MKFKIEKKISYLSILIKNLKNGEYYDKQYF